MNKKGDERVLYFYWFFLFVIVAVAIVIGVGVFYGHPIDVRQAEVELLVDKVIDCLIDGGIMDKEVEIFNEEKIEWRNILDFCKLNFRDEKYEVSDLQYYVNVSFFYLDDCQNGCESSFLKIIEGNKFYFPRCDFKGKDRNSPQCIDKKVYSVINEKEVVVGVVAGIGKVIENA